MIWARLTTTIAQQAKRTALACGTQALSYTELGAQIMAARAGLSRLGVGTADLVLLVLPNCPEFAVTYFATAGLAARVLALDPALTADAASRYLTGCRPKAVVTTPRLAPLFLAASASSAAPPAIISVGGLAGPGLRFADLVREPGDPLDPAADAGSTTPWVIAYSSGSTGEPRQICRSQGNQLAEANQIIASASITPGDVILCPLPLFHALGQFCCMLVALLGGALLVLLEPAPADGEELSGGADPADVLALIERHRVTVLPCVPYLLGALADWPDDRPADLSSVRLCLSGSNFLPHATRDRFLGRFGVPVRQTYGSSEAGSVSWDCDADGVAGESVGRPLRGVLVEIHDDDGTGLPPASVGEIVVTGASVISGPDHGASANGRTEVASYRTGDLGYLGADGRLYLTGRKRILVDVGGHKVNPVEVEAVLEAHPAVRAAAVVGVPLGAAGELLIAVVEPAAGLAEYELREYCRDHLLRYQIPARFDLSEPIPRTPLGKIRRSELASRLAGRWPAAGQPASSRPEDGPVNGYERILTYLRAMAADVIGLQPLAVPADLPLRTLGLDSLAALRLQMAIGDKLRQAVGLADLLGPTTIAALARRLATQGDHQPDSVVHHGPVAGRFALSLNQMSIWHADQLAPGDAAYNQSFAAWVTSRCNPHALRRTFQTLVNRHPALRTTFEEQDGQLTQLVAARATVDFEIVSRAWREDQVSAKLSAETYRPFDLKHEMPFRVRLLHCPALDPILLVTMHHLVTDFWSAINMLAELEVIYAAEASGSELYRPAPPYAYTDYARWLDEAVAGPVGQRDWSYWRETLRDLPAAPDLPLDKPRPPIQSRRGTRFLHDLGQDTVLALQELARSKEATTYALLLTAFNVFLHACTAEHDLAVAVITTNRQRPEFSDVVGYFVNPVVCRVQVDPRQSFTALLSAVRTALLGGLEHQTLPFEAVVRRLNLRRDPSRAPLVEIGFGQSKAHDERLVPISRFLSGGGHALRLGTLALESIPLEQRGVVYDFAGAVYETPGEISISWEYSSDLFEDQTIKLMAERFEVLLRSLLDQPEAPVGEAELMPDAERERLLSASRGARRTGQPATVPALIADQARVRPDATAVADGLRSLTYRELSEICAGLAASVIGAGAEPGGRVVIALPLSVDLVVAGLAIGMAGGVCDAVDYDAPDAEVRAVLAQSRARVFLTTAANLARFSDLDLAVICPGHQRARPVPGSAPAVGCAAAAVVLRTSGVTGAARAFTHSHRSLADLAAWLGEHCDPRDSVLVHGGQAPDRALARALAAIAAGRTVTLTEAGATPPDLARLLVSGGQFGLVTVTAAELAGLLAELAVSPGIPRIGTLCVGGDSLPARLVRQWRELTGPTRVLHEYGGADTALVVSAWDIPADARLDGPVSTGLPAPGIDRYVLDAGGRLCPPGVRGEVCLSAAARPAGPQSEPPGRWHRTGDVGYYLASGEVIVESRDSEAVALRGYRVCLPQVEAQLANRQSCVYARAALAGDGPDQRLVLQAKLRPGEARPQAAAELWESLRSALPAYLVPADLELHAELPMARNGKLARVGSAAAARPSAEPGQVTVTEDLSYVQAQLAAIWAEVLGKETVRLSDDYFELDGDSISSMQIVSRAAALGITISARQIFTHSILRDLASVAELATAPSPAATVSAEPGTEQRIPLAPIQCWLLDQQLAQPARWNQAIALNVATGLDQATVAAALRAVAQEHAAFRFRFARTDGGWVQTAQPRHDPIQLRSGDADAPGQVAAQLHASLDLERGPLLAAAIIAPRPGAGLQILIVAHHLVVDFVSWQIVIDDLDRACQQLRNGSAVSLPAATTPYARWAELMHERAASASVRAQLDYWARQAGRPQAPSPPSTERHARAATGALSPELTKLFLAATTGRDQARGQDVALAAVARALARFVGADEVRIDVEGHGRDAGVAEADLSRTVGWFTTAYPVDLALPPDADPHSALAAVRAALLAVPGDGAGYGLLRYLCPDPAVRARLAATARPIANFNYLGRMGRLVEGGGHPMSGARLLNALPSDQLGDRGERNRMPYPLEISGLLANDQLAIRVIFSAQQYQRRAIDSLVTKILEGIQEIVLYLTPNKTR